MTTFVDMYHPALGNVHISVPDIPAALSLYQAHGWVLSTGVGPDPTPIDLTVGLGDLRYAKLGDIPTPGTATGDALRAAFAARPNLRQTMPQRTVYVGPVGRELPGVPLEFTSVGISDGTGNTSITWTNTGGVLSKPSGGTGEAAALVPGTMCDGRIGALVKTVDTASGNSYAGVAARWNGSSVLVAYLFDGQAGGGRSVQLYELTINPTTYNQIGSTVNFAADSYVDTPSTPSWTDLQLEVIGATARVYVNGLLQLTATIPDSLLVAGRFGVASQGARQSDYKAINVVEYDHRYTPATATKYLALGTSIADGAGASAPANSYREKVADLLTNLTGTRMTVINGGQGGATSDVLLGNLPGLLATNSPQLVTIETPINDAKTTGGQTAGQTLANVRKMIALTKAAGAVPVLLSSAPMKGALFGGGFTTGSYTLQAEANGNARLLAAEQRVLFVDLVQAVNGDTSTSFLSTDNLHPNDAGHLSIAQAIARVVTGASRVA